MGLTVYFNGIGYHFENDEDLLELLDSRCNDTTDDIGKGNMIVYDDEL